MTENKRWPFLLLFLAAILAYAPGFWNGFVYDDESYVLANPLVRGKLDVGKIFTTCYPPNHPDQGLYRPLLTLSYHLDGKLWGFAAKNSWNGFHFTNSLLHGVNACLLWLLLGRLGLGFGPRSWSCLIFAIHPALSESVAWISGRAELLSSTFGLLAILIFLGKPRKLTTGFAFPFWIAAMLCKENWLMLPFLVALLAWLMPDAIRIGRRRAIFSGIAVLAIGAAFWTIRAALVHSWHPSVLAYAGVVTPATRVFTALGALWKYILLWLWPLNLSIHHEVRPVDSLLAGAAIVVSWLTAFAVCWKTRRRFPWLALALGWFWIAMLPVSNLIIPIGAAFGERFLYLSALFFAPAGLVGLRACARRLSREEDARILFHVAIVAWALFLAVLLWLRLEDWQSNLTLWEAAARIHPNALAIKGPWSEALLLEGRFGEAHRLASEAVAALERQPPSYQKLLGPRLIRLDANAQSLMRQLAWVRRFEAANQSARNLHPQEALDAYRALIEEFPERPETHEAIGDLYVLLQNPEAARQNYVEAINLGAKNPRIFAKYGQVLSELGNKAEALMAYDIALKANPLDPLTHYNRGVVLGDLGDYGAALAAFREATRLQPKFAAPHLNAAAILIHLKRYDEARRDLAQVLALDPRQKEANELLRKISDGMNPRPKMR